MISETVMYIYEPYTVLQQSFLYTKGQTILTELSPLNFLDTIRQLLYNAVH